MEKGAATLKRLFLELGGKSATIVLDDADFGTASPRRSRASATTPVRPARYRTRMLVPRDRYDQAVETLDRPVSNPSLWRPPEPQR